MPENALLTKITHEANALTNRLITNPILTRTLESRYTLPDHSSQKKTINSLWLTDFLNDFPHPLRTHCQSLMESKIGEVNSLTIEKIDKILYQKLSQTPDEFVEQTKDLIELCLKLTLVTSTVAEFVLEDLSKVEKLFTS